MKKLWIGVLLAGGATSFGQTHKVVKPETVVRAVGVYEWTGDLAKPTASRLIPVTLYIDKKLEDAGVYLARPVPFALETGNIYELDEAGVPKGNLDLSYARHLQPAGAADAYDDGWFGYGSFKPLVAPKKTVARKLPPARTSGVETASSSDPDKPHFSNKAGQPVTPASSKTPDTSDAKTDADKDAASASAKDTKDSSGSTPAGDPDRPTMKRRSGNDTASTGTTTSTTDSSTRDSSTRDSSTPPSDDPDRPTLKRHSVEDAKRKAKEPEASVTGVGSLNDDPDRPNLHRGKPTKALTEAELPKLSGLPSEVQLRQMVAVSDAANRPVHDFARPWDDDAERVAILGKMQSIAQAQLAAYGATPATAAAAVPNSRPSTAGGANSKMRRPLNPVRIAVVSLMDEQLKGYLLSYGDVPTFVYQAHTNGTGADLRYVTIVAQRDAQGEPRMVLHAVTDATHLDRTARLRLVDAVDVQASNRASLLFEMRGQTSRQFGVYRVLGMQAEQIFSSGSTQ